MDESLRLHKVGRIDGIGIGAVPRSDTAALRPNKRFPASALTVPYTKNDLRLIRR